MGHSGPEYIYYTETDISIDNGPGINEREFIDALLRLYPDRVLCVVPRGERSVQRIGISYVVNHQRRSVLYPIHVADAFRTIARLRRKYPVRALVTRLGVSPVVPLLVSRFLGIPIILKTLAKYSAFSRGVGRVRRVVRVLTKRSQAYVREVVSSAACADTVSETYKLWLHSQFGLSEDKLVVIRNAANTDMFRPMDREESRRMLGLDSFDRIIGYVGALAAERHVDLLIKCMSAISGPSRVGCLIVGNGPERYSLEQLARREGVEDRVILVGAVPYEDVPRYINAMDIAVDLSAIPMKVNGSTLLASYSQKIPQYLACGVPVLAWKCVDNHYLEEHRLGRLVEYGNLEALADGLREMLWTSVVEGSSLKARIRAYAESQSSITQAVRTRVELWERILRGIASDRCL